MAIIHSGHRPIINCDEVISLLEALVSGLRALQCLLPCWVAVAGQHEIPRASENHSTHSNGCEWLVPNLESSHSSAHVYWQCMLGSATDALQTRL